MAQLKRNPWFADLIRIRVYLQTFPQLIDTPYFIQPEFEAGLSHNIVSQDERNGSLTFRQVHNRRVSELRGLCALMTLGGK